MWNDIGVLTLTQPIPDVVYELLPSTAEATATLAPEATVDLVGYGVTTTDTMEFGIKTQGRATLVEVGTHELFIGKPGEQQNCNGDSGGPAFLDAAGERRVFGVVSRGPDSDPTCDHGGLHTRVDPYVSWIVSVAPQLCDELDCGATGVPRPREPEVPQDDDPPLGDPTSDAGGCRTATSLDSGLLLVLLAIGFGRRRSALG